MKQNQKTLHANSFVDSFKAVGIVQINAFVHVITL